MITTLTATPTSRPDALTIVAFIALIAFMIWVDR
jgi:hypothetical protein